MSSPARGPLTLRTRPASRSRARPGGAAQKAFGWWGGPGMEGWQKIVAGMRFQPAALFTFASVGAELVGGLLLAVGLFTPLAATALIGQSVVIILKAHLPHGFWNKAGGV